MKRKNIEISLIFSALLTHEKSIEGDFIKLFNFQNKYLRAVGNNLRYDREMGKYLDIRLPRQDIIYLFIKHKKDSSPHLSLSLYPLVS